MERAKAFGIKLIVFTIITFSFFGIFNHVSLTNLLLISVIITGVTFIGDMVLLPRMNSFLAAVGDFIIFALLFYGLGTLFVESSTSMILTSLAAAYIATFAEAIIHIYINERVFGKVAQPTRIMSDLQTEFAEETDVEEIKEKVEEEDERK